MDQSNSLLLNEQALKECPDQNKPVFFYEWLRYLDRILPVTQKSDIKTVQQKLVEHLTQRISAGPGPPTRALLAKCLAQVFAIADTYDLFQTINMCNDALKVKDDSNAQLQVKLTALAVLGQLYESLGKMVGRSYEESFQLMAKWIKSAESTSRTEILLTLAKMVDGLGPSAHSIHKDLYKLLAKGYLTDRVMSVRVAAVKCLHGLVSDPNSPIYTGDHDSILTLALKSLDESHYEVRFEVAKVFGKVVAHTVNQKPQKLSPEKPGQTGRQMTLEDALGFMSIGFLRGGIGGFLKTSHNAVAGGHKRIRVGMALAYIEVCRELGTVWLERNLLLWQKHLVQIAFKIGPLAYTNNPAQAAEAIHMRKCVSYIFRQTIGQILSESAQITACKNFGALITEYCNYLEIPDEEERVLNADGHSIAAVCTVCLLEVAALVRQVNTAITPLFTEPNGIQEAVFSCLLHPFKSARYAAAWCLRSVIGAVPHLATPLIDRCLNRLEHLRQSAVAVSGFSACLAALAAESRHSALGIPFQRSRTIFHAAEDLIKTAAQSSKLALHKTEAGWLLMTALISMGTPYLKNNLNRLVMLWKCSFPRSVEEAKAEKGRGDAFTWECILESRAGALAAMECFVIHCPELMTAEVAKRMVQSVETTLATMALVGELLGAHGVRLRHPIHLLRIRLYALLNRLPFKQFEHVFNSLLRELVADITLSDNVHANSAASNLAEMCATLGDCLLGGWIRNCSHVELELEKERVSTDLQMHPAQSVRTGALDYDPLSLVIGAEAWPPNAPVTPDDEPLTEPGWPQPLPPQLASLDMAVQMFGRVYPLVPTKHKLQLTNHFLNCLANLKPGARLLAIQLNVLGAMLAAMKAMGEYRSSKIEGQELQEQIVRLLRQFVTAENALQRCLAIEGLGRMAQAVADPKFFAGLAQSCFTDLQALRDEKSRSGLALTLGSLHRHVGSLGSGHHLHTAVSLVLSLAQDHASSTIRAWALFSLSLIACTGGGMFRGYVEPSLAMCIRLLLTTPQTNVDVIQCIAKLVSALITAVGPELPSTDPNMEKMRSSFVVACSMMFEHSDPQIQAEALACQQQLHLFAPRFVDLDRLVSIICHQLYSPHFVLRKAAINCLKQLLQREAKEVREHAQQLVPAGLVESKLKNCPLPETGLEGALFDLLDLETESEHRQNVKECLLFLVQNSAGEMLSFWLQMCKDILASSNTENIRSTLVIRDDNKSERTGGEEVLADDDDTLQGVQLGDTKVRDKVAPRYPTRVFAFTVVRRLMTLCETERAHLDLALAKELQISSSGRQDYLVLHLADLVRMSFMGATSEIAELRLAGLSCLHDVIDRFAKVPEPEFPGHVILEQFQAQVGAALRPAFEPETPSHVTAAACQVCSAWIGSGVARDLNDLRRVHQLLVSSLDKLKHGALNAQLYNESAATLEKLSILKAWAEVYAVAIQQEQRAPQPDAQQVHEPRAESLLSLVQPELSVLLGHWLAALRDSALSSLPAEFADQIPKTGGTFFTMDSAESCKDYYRQCWPPMLLASSIWLKLHDHGEVEEVDRTASDQSDPAEVRRQHRFYLMLGMCVEALVNTRHFTDNDRTIHLSLDTLRNLIDSPWARNEFMRDVRLSIEVMNVLHRLILTRDSLALQQQCVDVVETVMDAAKSAMIVAPVEPTVVVEEEEEEGHSGSPTGSAYADAINGNAKAVRGEADDGVASEDDTPAETVTVTYPDGFDPHTGRIRHTQSLPFAALEVCLCVLARQMPQINADATSRCATNAPAASGPHAPPPAPQRALQRRPYAKLSADACELIARAVDLLDQVVALTSPPGRLVLLPSVFYLIVGVLRESSALAPHHDAGHVTLAAAASMKTLRALVASPPTQAQLFEKWSSVIRSAMLSLLKMGDNRDEPVDQTVIMLATCVMITSAPRELDVGALLFFKACEVVRNCLKSDSFQVRYKALQTVNSLFQRRDTAPTYVKELGPAVFAKLKPYLTDKAAEAQGRPAPAETELPVLASLSDPQLLTIQETIKAVEAVLAMSKGDKQFMFVNLLVRCLVRFLCPEPETQLKALPENVRKLHEFAYQRLNLLGPKYPEAFRALVQHCQPVRDRIEAATQLIQRQKEAHQQLLLQQQQKADAARQAALNAANQQPTIKLSTDFSRFT